MLHYGLTLWWLWAGYVVIPVDGKHLFETGNGNTDIYDAHTVKHCPGVDNSADHLSSGANADQLKGLDTCWRGPAWLSKGVESLPCNTGTTKQSPPEGRITPHTVLHIQTPATLLDPSRYSSYWRLLRVTAWIFRFIWNIRRTHRSSGELTALEFTQALLHWIKSVQAEFFSAELDALQKTDDLPRESKITRFNPFLEDGLIRLGGRLQCADLSKDLRHPILLHGNHRTFYLLIWQMHIRLHHLGVRIILSELREEFLDFTCKSSHKEGAAQMSSL